MKLRVSIKIAELSSLICLFCFVFADIIKGSPIEPLSKIISLVGLGAFLLQLIANIWKLSNKIKVRIFLLLLSIIIIIVIQFLLKGDTRLLFFVMGIFSTIWMEESSIVKCLFWASLSGFALSMLTGGYGHINGVALHAGTVLLLYICNQPNKLKPYQLLCIIAVYVIISLYTGSGSSAFALGFGVLLEVLLFLVPRITIKFLRSFFVKIWFPIAFVGYYFVVLCYGTLQLPGLLGKLTYSLKIKIYKITTYLDSFLSGRLSLGQFAIKEFGVSFWGGNVKPYNNFSYKGHYFNLDSGMLWLLIGRGILITILFLIAMTIITKYFSDRKKLHFVIAIIVITLWSMNEDMLTSVSENFVLLFLGNSMLNVKNNMLQKQFQGGIETRKC